MVLLHDKTPLCDQSSEVRNGVHNELYILQIPFTVRCANSEVLYIWDLSAMMCKSKFDQRTLQVKTSFHSFTEVF